MKKFFILSTIAALMLFPASQFAQSKKKNLKEEAAAPAPEKIGVSH